MAAIATAPQVQRASDRPARPAFPKHQTQMSTKSFISGEKWLDESSSMRAEGYEWVGWKKMLIIIGKLGFFSVCIVLFYVSTFGLNVSRYVIFLLFNQNYICIKVHRKTIVIFIRKKYFFIDEFECQKISLANYIRIHMFITELWWFIKKLKPLTN